MLPHLPFDISSLHHAYENGLDPRSVIAEAFKRISDAADPGIFLHPFDRARLEADIDRLGRFDPEAFPLWGIPFAVKDNIDVKDAPTTAACPDFAYTAEQDAFVVNKLRAAGALLVGKTNLDQFATGLVGVRTPYPAPRNALDPAIVPGGSSSGSAVAVARGLVSFALGTDTAGSGRVPAALNGIVGLKPTLGALSCNGVVPACRTLDAVSVFALGVEDANRVFRVACAFDPKDAYSRQVLSTPVSAPPPAFRVGIPDAKTLEFFGDEAQAKSFSNVIATLRDMGGAIVEIDFTPFFNVAKMLYEGAWVAERLAAIESHLKAHPESLHPVTRQIIEGAQRLSAADAFRGQYRLAALKREAEPLLHKADLLCVPSIPTFYSLEDIERDPIGPNARLGTYTNFVNLMDLCALTVPTRQRADGRPGSATLIARAGCDGYIAAIGCDLQVRCEAPLGATDWTLPEPLYATALPCEDEIALAVVGAHMSGLPLNHELTALGGRFLGAAKTAPVYRLYRLAGGPPMRPGLVRDVTGFAIALEVWALPASRFADFMRSVPSPLGIGTLALEDGCEVKGFICEPVAIADAKDVTAYGGWRAYLQSLTPNEQPKKEFDHAQA
ncbi:Allophanate hydrolase [Rhodospirillaceae bacterium LM-1]|nr:Allophanate hydrolase [Rhodospirillaceae bacterium LM-1]